MDYVLACSSKVRKKYQPLMKALSKRYGHKETASYLRKKLTTLKQRDDENEEDFADRVYEMANEGYKGASAKFIEEIAIQ